MTPMDTVLRKWYKLEAVTFICPYCTVEYDFELKLEADIPTSVGDSYVCGNCNCKINFSNERTEYL